jgi:hypothetical protein
MTAALEGNPIELMAQIDNLSLSDLYTVYRHSENLTRVLRDEWMNKTRRMSGEADGG